MARQLETGKEYEVFNGPSKMDLMLAQFDTENGTRPLFFHLRDISGEELHPSIIIFGCKRLNLAATEWELQGMMPQYFVHVCYNSSTRQGVLMFSEKPNYAEEAAQSPFMGTRKAKTLMILIYRIIALYQNHNAGNLSEEIFRQYEFAKRVRDASDEAALARALKELAPD